MKILAINGSPSGKNGATWWVLEKFLDGVRDAGHEPEVIHLAGKKIHYCTGELACWTKTPGKCIHKDDMEEILNQMKTAEAVVLATPVYVDGMTGLLKNCLDRTVPIAEPYFEMRDGHCRHAAHESVTKRVALVSVCGFHELDNFGPLVEHTKAVCRNMNAEFAGAVLRPAAPMFPHMPTIHPLFFKIRAVTKAIRKAGNEFGRDGKISGETTTMAAAEVITKEQYAEQANKHFAKALADIKK